MGEVASEYIVDVKDTVVLVSAAGVGLSDGVVCSDVLGVSGALVAAVVEETVEAVDLWVTAEGSDAVVCLVLEVVMWGETLAVLDVAPVGKL